MNIHILLSRDYQAEILKSSFPVVRKSQSSAPHEGNGQGFALDKAPSRSQYLYCQVSHEPPSFFQGHPPPLYPYQIPLQSNSSKDLPVFLLLPTQAEHTCSPTSLTAFQQLFQTYIHHSHCAVSSTAASAGWVHTPPPLIHHPHSLTHLLPSSGHNTCPNRSSEQVSKGKGKTCPLPGRGHGDSKQQ